MPKPEHILDKKVEEAVWESMVTLFCRSVFVSRCLVVFDSDSITLTVYPA